LGRALVAAGLAGDSSSSHCLVIDAAGALGKMPGAHLSVPRLERVAPAPPAALLSQILMSPHPAAIVLSTLLLRLAARFTVKGSVAQVFFPASEMGPRAIDELQKQTLNLLTFQKIPEKVYGAQLAFNVLPRLPGKHHAALNELDARVRHELRQYLGARVPAPALQLCQVAVFYSLAFSVFVEFDQPATAEALTAALAGEGISVRRPSEAAPSPIEAAGSGAILIDAVTVHRDQPNGCWIWAAVDNIRLAAENAADIALNSLPHLRQKQ
jgi:aspartate-semialdehyde dehydrogenase